MFLKYFEDRMTDRQTDRQTDGQKKLHIKVTSHDLKGNKGAIRKKIIVST